MASLKLNDDGQLEVSVNGEIVFVGSSEELAAILMTHKQFTDYIDAHDGDGNEIR
jgi:hypothetical protein